MSHPLLKTAIRFFFIAILVIVPAKIATACLCANRPAVLEEYEAADEVLIVRVLSFQTLDEPDTLQHGLRRTATVIVERVYKGKVKIDDRLVFAQRRGFNCFWRFDDARNEKFLLYLNTPAKPDDLWEVAFCGRSSTVAKAREDLLYLDNRKNARGRTRVSGKYLTASESDLVVADKKIRILGDDEKVYETTTDDLGVFEIYDLPPGNYRLETEVPAGWRIVGSWPRSTNKAVWKRSTVELIHFVLEAQKHASINVLFQPSSSVEGTIVGPNGNPLIACAHLWTPEQMSGGSLVACSDVNGRFRFEYVPAGSYVLVINPSGKPSSAAPFPKLFYPGTEQRENAALITVGLGETVKNVNLVAPTVLETITVQGVLYFADGQPVSKQAVRFSPASTDRTEGYVQADTDEKGRFSLKIIKGLKGRINSVTFGQQGAHEECPEFNALLKDSADNPPQVSTPAIAIEAEQDLHGLVLRLPFPRCTSKE